MSAYSATKPAVRALTPMSASASFNVVRIDNPVAPRVPPVAFIIGDWTLTNPASGGTLDVGLVSVPADSVLVEYRVDGGSWVSSGGITSFQITGLTDTVLVSVELRATNTYGQSASSDTKTATPTAV